MKKTIDSFRCDYYNKNMFKDVIFLEILRINYSFLDFSINIRPKPMFSCQKSNHKSSDNIKFN